MEKHKFEYYVPEEGLTDQYEKDDTEGYNNEQNYYTDTTPDDLYESEYISKRGG